MFDGKRINSLETSVTTLTEELEKANNMIEALFSNFEEVVEKLNDVQSENNKLKNEISELKKQDFVLAEKFDLVCIKEKALVERCDDLAKSLNIYAEGTDKDLEEIHDKLEMNNSSLKDEIVKIKDAIEKLFGTVAKLEEKSNNADKEHDELLAILKDNNERLIKKCEELQLSNVQIMNQHNDMIKRYEQSIKEYAEQTQNMKNNILKKMNANNIISVVEE